MKSGTAALENDVQEICNEMNVTASTLRTSGKETVFKISRDSGHKFVFTYKLRVLGWNASSGRENDKEIVVFDV